MRKITSTTVWIVLASIWLGMASNCFANAISVTNLSIAGVSGGTADIQFDVSWSNSWNLSWSDDGGGTYVTNWDAAWVFLKFRTADGNWRHGMLASSGHTAPSGALIELGSNGEGTNVGVFVRKDITGSGAFPAQGVRLRWDFAQSNLGGTGDVDISIHAIEMVYIPKGKFALGSGGGDGLYKYPNVTDPYWVTNENAILCGSVAGRLSGLSVSLVSNVFPKGYAPIYCMKYEITQGQYASFLNHLPSWDATLRYPAQYGNSRYAISNAANSFLAIAPDRACNFFSPIDLCAYLDWAALRPVTELEYEKVCRGPLVPEPREFPWGTTTLKGMTSINGVDGSGSETALPEDANYPTGGGVVRVGMFAEPGSGRQKSGAGYYGVLDLFGNVCEIVVSADTGKDFTPEHGDGSISAAPVGWPPYTGFSYRGAEGWTTSQRASSLGATRSSAAGGRGVRSFSP